MKKKKRNFGKKQTGSLCERCGNPINPKWKYCPFCKQQIVREKK